jgi:nucleoside-diphosphate-sugar epimerase
MKVLVTGGSGFLGINLVRYLLERDISVSVIDKETFEYPEASRITFFHGDIRDEELLNKAMNGIDSVVHTAAALPLHSKAEIFSVEIDGTRMVFEAARKHGIKSVIHISSTAVYGVPDHHPLKETDQVVGVGPYGHAKIEAERVAESFRPELDVTILRPKSFIGPERLGVFALLYDWASSGAHFPIPGKGTNLYQYLDVEDLCWVIHRCLLSKGPEINETYNVGAKEFSTFKADFQSVLDLAGFGKRIVSFPAMPAIWVLRFLDRLGLSPLYPWVYETAVKDSFVSIDKAQQMLGFNPRFSNQQALERNYNWYVSNRESFAGQSGKTHRVPWKQGVLGILKKILQRWP